MKANSKKITKDKNHSKKNSFRMSASVNKQKVDLGDEAWDFSDYLRYLIIAAIIIIFLFVFSSMMMSAKKSQD